LQRQVGDVAGQMPIAGPAKIFALESTGKFLRFRALTVSATIDVDWLNNYWSVRAFALLGPGFVLPSLRRHQATTKTHSERVLVTPSLHSTGS
jgi:hypothetical protein